MDQRKETVKPLIDRRERPDWIVYRAIESLAIKTVRRYQATTAQEALK